MGGLIQGIGNVGSNILFGPGHEQLEASERATRMLLTLAAGSQNPAGIVNAHQQFAAQNAMVREIMASPEFQALSPEQQALVLPAGYRLPSALPPPSAEARMKHEAGSATMAMAGEAKRAGSAPDYLAALGIPRPPSMAGEETAATLASYRRAGLEPESFARTPAGVSVKGEVPGEIREVTEDEIRSIGEAAQAGKLRGVEMPGFQLIEQGGKVYVQKESPADQKRREATQREIDKQTTIVVTKDLSETKAEGASVREFIAKTKELGRAALEPKAFANSAGGAAQGVLYAGRQALRSSSFDNTASAKAYKRYLAFVDKGLTKLGRLFGEQRFSDADREYYRRGLTQNGLTYDVLDESLGDLEQFFAGMEQQKAALAGEPMRAQPQPRAQPAASPARDALRARHPEWFQ